MTASVPSEAGRSGASWRRGNVRATVDPGIVVETDDVTGGRVVRVGGEIDLMSTERLRDALIGAGAADGSSPDGSTVAPTVWVDLSPASFIDAAGIGVLVSARNALVARGGDLSVTGATGLVRRVFELCGLSVLLDD